MSEKREDNMKQTEENGDDSWTKSNPNDGLFLAVEMTDINGSATAKTSDDYEADSASQSSDSDSDSSDDEDQVSDWKGCKAIEPWQKAFRTYAPIAFKLALLVSYTVYFVFAMMCNFGSEPSIRILVFSCILYTYLLKKYACKIKAVQKWSEKVSESCSLNEKHKFYIQVAFKLLIVGAIVAAIILRAINSPYNLVSVAGLFGFVGLCFFVSAHPRKVNWYPVISGIALQLIIGILVLNVPLVYAFFDWLASRINGILDAAYYGCEFVFGKGFQEHFFIFLVSAQILYFGAVLGVMKYYGWIQWLTYKISSALQLAMHTQPAESIVAAANIFLGQMNAAMVLTPVLDRLTRAELHSILTSGMSTVAGATIGIYAGFGVPIQHMIIASFMSAPAALAMSRLVYPENKKSKITKEMLYKLPKKEEANLFDAFSCGAVEAIEVVVGVMVNVLVYVSALGFINSCLAWLAEAVCISTPITFGVLCSYVFWPLAFMMGADAVDCLKVAELIGTKIFLNELVAYSHLGVLINNKLTLNQYNGTVISVPTGLYLVDSNTTLVGGILQSDRSEVISTYALCGFSNLGSIGIMIGGIAALAPSRRRDVTQVALRSVFAANVACFMTACVAGALYRSDA